MKAKIAKVDELRVPSPRQKGSVYPLVLISWLDDGNPCVPLQDPISLIVLALVFRI